MRTAYFKEPRPDKTTWFLEIARVVASEATCLRRKFGAVLVDTRGFIVSTGYCGSVQKCEDCLERGWCYRERARIPSGANYERCYSIHAEENALLQAGLSRARGCTIYLFGWDVKERKPVTVMPCLMCAKSLVRCEVERVVEWDFNRRPTEQGDPQPIISWEPWDILCTRLQEAGMEVPQRKD